MNNVWQDVRYSARLMMKRPASAVIVILTLALGIGANTAVFTVINSLLIRPLPYTDADRIAYIHESSRTEPTLQDSISPHNFTDLRSRIPGLDSYFAYRYHNLVLTGAGRPEALISIQASGDFGRVLGVTPALGRLFGADEDVPGRNRVVVLSDSLWKRRFGGDRQAIGSKILLDGEPFTVLGVMSPVFQFPSPDADLWTPLALDLSKSERGTSFLSTVARMQPGVSPNELNASLNQISSQLAREYPNDLSPDVVYRAEPIKEHLFGKLKRPLMILIGAVTLVLLIACVNVANLMLGRSTVRSREMAVRAALGASRAGLVQLLLIEGILLSIIGGFAGLLLAGWGVQFLTTVFPAAVPGAAKITIDASVLIFTGTVSIVTGLLFGLVPALHATYSGMNRTLHDNSRSSTGTRGMKWFRSGLVVTEIGLSLLLLIGAALLLRSLQKVTQIKPGFDVQNVVTCTISLPETRYADPRSQAQFFRQMLEKAQTLPDVESAGLATSMPFSGSRGSSTFSIDGRADHNSLNGPVADRHQVSPGYFHAMRIPIQRGRDFTDNDNISGQQVVIINEAAAARYWPGENPIGKRIKIGMPNEVALYGKPVSREIVAIVGNIKHEELTGQFSPEMYIPAWQLPAQGMSLVLRGHSSAESILAEVRAAIESIDPDQPVRNVKVLRDSVARSLAPRRFLATLLMLFAGLALVLALIGIYAVMSFSVAQRIPEIGVRMALGAAPRDALMLILGQGLSLAALGLGAGLVLTALLTDVLRNLLFEVSPTDPATFCGVSALLLTVTLAACLIPARRATRVDPMNALRCE